MSRPVNDPSAEPLDLLIVGAGFSGLGMAIRADRAGFGRFLVLEKAGDVGGTWQANTYPGAASDIPSHLYSLSFAPKADWSRLFPRQPEIEAYLRGLVDTHALRDRLRLNTRVEAARWDEAAGLWRVEAEGGPYAARVLVSAIGALHQPAIPRLAGLDRFAGPAFHSARWDHGCDLAAKRVGVVGTGASAIQIVPEIVGEVAHLTLFQRSAPWVLPRRDRPISEREKWFFARVPLARWLFRQRLFWEREMITLGGFTRVSKLTETGEAIGRHHMRTAVADEALREKLTPRFRLGCKRVLLSDDYYPALARPNVAVVTDAIDEVLPHGIRTADGVEHPLDVLVFGTGFDVTGSFDRIDVVGRDGASLKEAWREGMDAFQGLAVHGFPNLFLLLGPNTGLGSNSVVAMIEAQVTHVLGALRTLRRRPQAALDVTRRAQDRFRAEVDRRMRGSIWTSGGCGSWYLDGQGRNRTLWPATVTAYWRGTRRMRRGDYTLLDQNRTGSSSKVGGSASNHSP